jgi:hypothetical protein
MCTLIGILIVFCVSALAHAQTASKPPRVATGSYECWANGAARMLLNFTIRNASQYTDSDEKLGTYTYDPASGRITFKGGLLDGAMPNGFQSIYHEPNRKPTVSFRSPRGAEAAFCEKAD